MNEKWLVWVFFNLISAGVLAILAINDNVSSYVALPNLLAALSICIGQIATLKK